MDSSSSYTCIWSDSIDGRPHTNTYLHNWSNSHHKHSASFRYHIICYSVHSYNYSIIYSYTSIHILEWECLILLYIIDWRYYNLLFWLNFVCIHAPSFHIFDTSIHIHLLLYYILLRYKWRLHWFQSQTVFVCYSQWTMICNLISYGTILNSYKTRSYDYNRRERNDNNLKSQSAILWQSWPIRQYK